MLVEALAEERQKAAAMGLSTNPRDYAGIGSAGAGAGIEQAEASVVLYERNGLRHGGFDLPVPLGACACAWMHVWVASLGKRQHVGQSGVSCMDTVQCQ